MNRKTLSRILVLSLVVALLATVVVGVAMAAEQQVFVDGQYNFTSFVSELWSGSPEPMVVACDGCSGGGTGPW